MWNCQFIASFTRKSLSETSWESFQERRLSLPWPDPDFYSVWFSSGGPLYAKSTGFADDALDKLLDTGRTTLDPAKRKTIYAQVEQRLIDLAPWVFLHWRPMGEATRANVKGYTRLPGALGSKSLGGLKYVWKE